MATVSVSKRLLIPLLLIVLCSLCFLLSQAVDTLRPGESLRDTDTLVSSGGVFELGFFSSGGPSSSNHYLGIWFKSDPYKKAVWVANREYPILDSSGVLTIRYDGNLVITDRRQIPIIVNSGMLANSSNTSAKLFDSGNIVLIEGEGIVWQSFYYPSDTFLPGMRLGFFNLRTGQLRQQFLVSWQSLSVPATGSFALGLYKYNRTQLKVWHRDVASQKIGFWDGQRFKFLFESSLDEYNFSYISNLNETYITFSNGGNNRTSWFVMASSGEINEFTMTGQEITMVNRSLCKGTSTVIATECFVMIPSLCQDGDEFLEINGLIPNSRVVNESVHLGLSDCEIICRSNCSCTAFASFRDDGTGCEFFYGDKNVLLDVVGEGNGTIYIRGDFPTKSDHRRKKTLWLIVIALIVSLIVLIVFSLMCYLRWRNHNCIGWKGNQDSTRRSLELFLFQFGTDIATIDDVSSENRVEFGRKKDHELPLLSFSCIETATDNFLAANKLGEGGFGPVYKGMLLGHEIAVKRLSRMSGQGLEEFKNEVHLISKLQHRNLVRLLGCCIQGEEKILIYEYLPNKSLDSFLFDASKRALLDWGKRIHIIEGIAQGLLYLHKYSRLRIIHRDLKTSNILLDGLMNPKISDFGMARIFREDEIHAKTTRVVGTYGYMSPEYAVHGLFSIKSDVFSFGVIMLEIISGKRNTNFCLSDRSLNLLGYTWDLWKDDRGMELMDPTLAESCSMSELMHCIQVGLLCVQESPEDRPTMSDVVTMLSNESTNLPAPKQPAFSTHSPLRRQHPYSVNDVTVSEIEAR